MWNVDVSEQTTLKNAERNVVTLLFVPVRSIVIVVSQLPARLCEANIITLYNYSSPTLCHLEGLKYSEDELQTPLCGCVCVCLCVNNLRQHSTACASFNQANVPTQRNRRTILRIFFLPFFLA